MTTVSEILGINYIVIAPTLALLLTVIVLLMLFIGIYPNYIESFVIQEASFLSDTIAIFRDLK